VKAPSSAEDLCFTSASDLVALIKSREVSAREVMAAHLERIARVNPKLNAIVAKLGDEQCLALADAADRLAASGEPLPPLHGLPTAFKDLQSAVGFPYTRGSTIYKDFMPTEDSVFVERMRAAGVIPIGKTNAPEFGMGSHTFNKVYGTTVNPYDVTKSAGGSSGGAGRVARERHAADRRRQRQRRLVAQSGQLQQRRRFSPDVRPRADRAERAPFPGLLGERPARSQRLRRGAAHERDGGP
jgi:Asp-tRNA(Asn)/Glu-tRNA(Gln) amidotransferase A subunit family amidase